MSEVNESARPPRIDRRIAAGLSNPGSRTQGLFVVALIILFLSLLVFLLSRNQGSPTVIRSSNVETPVVVVVIPPNISGPSGVTAAGAIVGVGGPSGGIASGSTLPDVGGGAGSSGTGASGPGGTPIPGQKGAGFVLVVPPTPAVINLVSVHATAEAAFARTPGARSSGGAAPKPASVQAQAPTPGAPAKPIVIPEAKPGGPAPEPKPAAPIAETKAGPLVPESKPAPPIAEATPGQPVIESKPGAPGVEKPNETRAPAKPIQPVPLPGLVISPTPAAPGPGEQGMAAISTIVAANPLRRGDDANAIGASPVVVEEPVATSVPTATVVPPATRTPTTTRTATVTETSTPTPTTTSTPGPCEATATIPFMSPGYGFFVTFIHEAPGGLRVVWKTVDGSITVFANKPGTFGEEASGSVLGVPADRPIGQGNSGNLPVNVNNRAAGTYTVYFFNGSQSPMAASNASVTFTTIGHCP